MADWFKLYDDTLDRERYQAPLAMCPFALNVLIWIMGKVAQTRCPVIQAGKRDLAGAAAKLHIPFGDFMAGLAEFLTGRETIHFVFEPEDETDDDPSAAPGAHGAGARIIALEG